MILNRQEFYSSLFFIVLFIHSTIFNIVYSLNNELFYISRFFVIGILVLFSTLIIYQNAITKYKLDKTTYWLLIIFIFYLIIDIVTKDTPGILEQIKFWGAILGIYTFTKFLHIDIRVILKLLIYILLPLVILNAVLSSEYPLSLLPFTDGNWRVTIQSIHYTGQLGILFFTFGLYSYIKKIKRPIVYSLIFLGIYLVVFSGSRSNLLAFLFLFFIFIFTNTKKLNYKHLLIPLLFTISVYVLPLLLQGIILDGFFGNVTKMNKVHDLSAGREWLWLYHIALFLKHPLIGNPQSMVSFSFGDIIDGQVAKAGSESMYTAFLAREGIFGLGKIFFYIWIVFNAIKNNNLLGYLIAGVILITNAGISTCANSYSFFCLLFLLFYFYSFQIAGRKQYAS